MNESMQEIKTMEGRKLSDKINPLRVGDKVILRSGSKSMTRTISEIRKSSNPTIATKQTFECGLLKKLVPGMNSKEALEVYHSFPGYARQPFCIIAIGVAMSPRETLFFKGA